MAKKITVDLELKYKEAVRNLDEFQKEYTKLEKQTKKTNTSVATLGTQLDKVTGGAITKFKAFRAGITNVVKGFKSLRVAIIATGIGALVVAIGSVTAAFKASEEGQNKFLRFFAQLQVVIGNVTDILADFGTAIIETFTFNFEEAGKALDKVTNGIKNFGEETQKEIEIAGKLADMRAKADKAERRLIQARAEANRKVAELREIAADKENVAVEERIEAIKEAGRVEQEITRQEIAAAQLRFEAKRQENALSKSTKEDLDEEARLRARLTELETGRLRIQKALTAEITTALREAEVERKQIIQDEINTNKEAANAFIESLKQIRQAERDLEKEEEEERAKRDEKNLERKQRIDESRIASEQMVLNAKKSAVDQAISLFGAETAAGKAALIAKQVIAAQEMIQEARKTITFSNLVAARSAAAVAEGTSQTSKIGFPQNIPMLIAYALQAVGIMSAVASAVGKSKSVASSLGGGGGGGATPAFQAPQTGSAPPAFNVVGASGANQLADAIAGQQGQPLKAFVVSGDVSTAQELDRNIVQGATIESSTPRSPADIMFGRG